MDPEHEKFLRAATHALCCLSGRDLKIYQPCATGSLKGKLTAPICRSPRISPSPVPTIWVFLLLILSSMYAPAVPEQRAWEKMQQVMDDIRTYKTVNGAYPAKLDDLPGAAPTDAWAILRAFLVWEPISTWYRWAPITRGRRGLTPMFIGCAGHPWLPWFDYTLPAASISSLTPSQAISPESSSTMSVSRQIEVCMAPAWRCPTSIVYHGVLRRADHSGRLFARYLHRCPPDLFGRPVVTPPTGDTGNQQHYKKFYLSAMLISMSSSSATCGNSRCPIFPPGRPVPPKRSTGSGSEMNAASYMKSSRIQYGVRRPVRKAPRHRDNFNELSVSGCQEDRGTLNLRAQPPSPETFLLQQLYAARFATVSTA
jgi:hypothetical protein